MAVWEFSCFMNRRGRVKFKEYPQMIDLCSTKLDLRRTHLPTFKIISLQSPCQTYHYTNTRNPRQWQQQQNHNKTSHKIHHSHHFYRKQIPRDSNQLHYGEKFSVAPLLFDPMLPIFFLLKNISISFLGFRNASWAKHNKEFLYSYFSRWIILVRICCFTLLVLDNLST